MAGDHTTMGNPAPDHREVVVQTDHREVVVQTDHREVVVQTDHREVHRCPIKLPEAASRSPRGDAMTSYILAP